MRKTLGTTLLMLLLGWAGAATAAGSTFGQWRVSSTTDGHFSYAATVNRRGEVFGEFCAFKSGSCHWLLAVHTPCRFGDVYPVLANSAAGATPIAIFCIGAIGRHTYGMALMNTRKLEASIANAQRVGFAVPLGEGRFAFAHFALLGRLQAMALLQRSFSAQVEQRRRIRSRETRL